ncbi:MAG: hypothetical protein KAH84_04065 [Thiomargarita sp.]|nr:hypothetical protein [Thiomargarita sp.]
MSYQLFSSITYFLLLGFSFVVVATYIIARFIVFHPIAFLNFIWKIPLLIKNPIICFIEILRMLALKQLLTWISGQIEAYCFKDKELIALREIFLILSCVGTLIFLSPSEIILEEIFVIAFFSIGIFYKIYLTKQQIKEVKMAKKYEKLAIKIYKYGCIKPTMKQFNKAYLIYQQPNILNNTRFDLDRALLFDNMALFSYKNREYRKASKFWDKAFSIYKKTDDFDGIYFNKLIKALKQSRHVLSQIQLYRKQAYKRSKLIYELTGETKKWEYVK